MEHNFDERKDYYAILGVPSNAKIEELKSAYVKLALQLHPDSATASSDSTTEFISVSEAWSVLSKPNVRQQYDMQRIRYLGTIGSNNNIVYSGGGVGITYSTQKSNYEKNLSRASSNWQDLNDKYKSETWRNMSVHEKKMHRKRPIHTFSSSIITVLVPLLIIGGAVYSINKELKKRL